MELAGELTGVTSVPPMIPQHGGRQLGGQTSEDESSEPLAKTGGILFHLKAWNRGL